MLPIDVLNDLPSSLIESRLVGSIAKLCFIDVYFFSLRPLPAGLFTYQMSFQQFRLMSQEQFFSLIATILELPDAAIVPEE